jgi:hypothetical protein
VRFSLLLNSMVRLKGVVSAQIWSRISVSIPWNTCKIELMFFQACPLRVDAKRSQTRPGLELVWMWRRTSTKPLGEVPSCAPRFRTCGFWPADGNQAPLSERSRRCLRPCRVPRQPPSVSRETPQHCSGKEEGRLHTARCMAGYSTGV